MKILKRIKTENIEYNAKYSYINKVFHRSIEYLLVPKHGTLKNPNEVRIKTLSIWVLGVSKALTPFYNNYGIMIDSKDYTGIRIFIFSKK